jgi:small subunit ribosomal protein S16
MISPNPHPYFLDFPLHTLVLRLNQYCFTAFKFLQKLGTYNPLTMPASVQLDRQRALDWLHKGAQPTDTVRKILSYKGVLYLKHLLRGVTLGLFDEATAMTKFQSWHSEHEAQIRKRQEEAQRERRGRRTPPYQRRERRPAPGGSEG